MKKVRFLPLRYMPLGAISWRSIDLKAALAMAFFLLSTIHGRAQSHDLRSHAEYGESEEDLRLKYQFYHDMWSERDVKHGRFSKWAGHDRLLVDGYYFEGLQDSLWRYWYGNGQLSESSYWRNGQRSGKTSLYDKKGRLLEEASYSLGKRDGITMRFHVNGKVQQVAQYRQGVLDGSVVNFNKKGIRKGTVSYQEGRKLPQEKEPREKREKAEKTKEKVEKAEPKREKRPQEEEQPGAKNLPAIQKTSKKEKTNE